MTSTSSHVENYDPTKFWVAPSRSYRTSARLHLQHLLIQNTLGYLLEPNIEELLAASGSDLRIADLACGNGIWLIDLETYLAKKNISAQLDGFDVNPVYFLDAAFLPPSISLKQLDILVKPIPAELVGVYDVVHIRAFNSAIPDGNLEPVLSTALALLKPGGFIQWEETRGDKWTVDGPAEVSKMASHGIVQLLQMGLKAKGISHDWLKDLDKRLESFGFQDTRSIIQGKRKQDYKGWTEDYLMAWDETTALFPPKSQAPNAPFTREAWLDLLTKVIEETEQGVVVHQDHVITAVGRKSQ
ncbi:hypothetical protein N7540_000142 [Penicillium herquei]|nr:hypothetical protein N7540_000142 [Penicillium herquei]